MKNAGTFGGWVRSCRFRATGDASGPEREDVGEISRVGRGATTSLPGGVAGVLAGALALGTACTPAPTVAPTVVVGPATAAAPLAAPSVAAVAYDPDADGRNDGGWQFGDTRAPDDAAGARKAPFRIADLYNLDNVGDPQWSPQGRRVAFTRTSYALEEGRTNVDVWIVEPGQGPARALTQRQGYDGSPRWLDEHTLLFVSDRGGSRQLFRLDLRGGDPERLTELPRGVGAPVVSPTGSHVALVTKVDPRLGDDWDAQAEAKKRRADNPVVAHVADELLYRHWTSYADGLRDHVVLLKLEDGTVVDRTPGDYDSPAWGHGGHGVAFSPDGTELAFTSNRDPGSAQSWTTNKDIWTVPVQGGVARNLTANNAGADVAPAYSPDGSTLAYLQQVVGGYEADRNRIVVIDRKNETSQVVTDTFPDTITAFHWAGNDTVLFVAPTQGRYPIYRLALGEGRITRLPIPGVKGLGVARDGRLAFGHTTIGQPIELFTADANGSAARRLTGFNDGVVDRVDIRPPEELWIEGADGRKVHAFVVKPHGFKEGVRYPTIFNVHGGPQSQWADTLRGDWQVYPGAGYVTVFFNPHGSTGYGQDYTEAISKDWGGKVYEDVMKVVEHMTKQPYVDPERLGAMGWSYGGYMMNWLLGHTDRFKAIASMMGIYDLDAFYGATEELWFPEWDLGGTPWSAREAYRKWSPHNYAEHFKTPTLVVTGELDYRVPYTQSLALFSALRRQGVPARLVVFPNDGHWPNHVKSMPLYYAAHLEWFAQYLGGGAPRWSVDALTAGTAYQAEAKFRASEED